MNNKFFTRLTTTDVVKGYKAEARRVKYKVVAPTSDTFEIFDNDEVVMRGIKFDKRGWMVRFSSLYWQEPELV